MAIQPLKDQKIIEGEADRELQLPSSKDPELESIEKELALAERKAREIDEKVEALENKYERDVDKLRLRVHRRADHLTQQMRLKYAEVAHNLAQGVDTVADAIPLLSKSKDAPSALARMIMDTASSPEEIRLAADTAAIEGIINVLGEDAISIDALRDKIDDPHMRRTLNEHRIAALLYRYHSFNMHDSSESTLIFKAPIASAVGYQLAGPIGVGVALRNIMNKAQASENMYYQLQQMCTKMQSEQMELMNSMNAYTMQKHQRWLSFESMRSAAAKDQHIPRSRVEFQNFVLTPHGTIGRADNLKYAYEARFRYLSSQWRGQQDRFMADLLASLATGGMGDLVRDETEEQYIRGF